MAPTPLSQDDTLRTRAPTSYELVFDGGSRGNPGRAYGSYRLRREGGRFEPPVRLALGEGTNNEAEYWTLIEALKRLRERLERDGLDLSDAGLILRGDSQLVVRQLRGEWKAKNPRMKVLRDQVMGLLEPFGAVEIEHQDREASLRILGH